VFGESRHDDRGHRDTPLYRRLGHVVGELDRQRKALAIARLDGSCSDDQHYRGNAGDCRFLLLYLEFFGEKLSAYPTRFRAVIELGRTHLGTVLVVMTSSSRKACGPAISEANAPRRRLLRGALAVFASALIRGAISPAQAQQKMSKQEAEYQDSPRDIRMCATCTLFEPPKSCKVVEGDVSPNGWCKAFVLAD
jgi:hypothetical protein